MSFSNLDLRLDVLESELRLPFTFVSGHIHELQIHVPWTRLNTEPIVITINTIECVLKLPSDDDPDHETCSTVSSTPSVTPGGTGGGTRSTRKSGDDLPAAPPGYVQSLINKIISNITIVCNNLILKYVEEDIVLSLNTRNLRLSSADEMWRPAFTELTLPDLILRKLLQVTDMTICLDKRNASGKIESYQEPLLYRCSLSIHAAWLYDSLRSKMPTVSRYEVMCPRLDFSLTDTQVPMFLRLSKLALSLYFGEIAQRKATPPRSNLLDLEMGEEDKEGHERGEHDGSLNASWTGWAWGVGSSVGGALLPIYWEDEDGGLGGGGEHDAPPRMDEMRDKVLHFGCYVDVASLVLKITGQQQHSDKMFSPAATKTTFSPFARFDFAGMFQEIVAKGAWLVNVSNGISDISFAPVGTCVCGALDADDVNEPLSGSDDQQKQDQQDACYLRCGDPSAKRHIRGSLFEKEFGSESGDQTPKERKRSYDFDWDVHLDAASEEKLLERTPAVAMDFLYHLDLPSDMTSDQLSEYGLDLEYSNMSERSLCRFVFGPARLNVCSGLIHRAQILAHFCSLYDYPPYNKADLESSATDGVLRKGSASQDELDHLMQESTMLRVYQLTAINPSVYLYHADHSEYQPRKQRRRRTFKVKSSPISSLPGLGLKMECLDAQFSYPMYPLRLVRAASAQTSSQGGSLSSPVALMKSCHSHLTAKIMQLSSHLFFGEQSSTVVQPSSFQIGWKSLQLPHFWQGRVIVLDEYYFDLSAFRARLTRPQTMVLQHVIASHLEGANPRPGKLCDTTILEDALTKRMASFVISVNGLRSQFSATEHIRTFQAGVESVGVSLHLVNKDSTKFLPILNRASSVANNSGGGIASANSHLSQSSFTRSPAKSSPGRAHTRSKLSAGSIYSTFESSGLGSASENLINVHAQFPACQENQSAAPSLFVGHVAQMDMNVDPKLLEWFLYFPQMKGFAPSQTGTPAAVASVSSAHLRLARDKSVESSEGWLPQKSSASDQGTRMPRTPSAKGAKSYNTGATSDKILMSSHKKRLPPVTVTRRKGGPVVDWVKSWYATLNGMLMQIRMDGHRIFVPRKSLLEISDSGGKTVSEIVQSAREAKDLEFSMLSVALPSVTLENLAHKPSTMVLQQFVTTGTAPIMLPESIWNWKRDNLPWALKLEDLSAHTEGMGEKRVDAKKIPNRAHILEPFSASCTLGLTMTAGDGGGSSGLALCVHTDMSPARCHVSDPQLSLVIAVLEEAMAAAAKLRPSLLLDDGGIPIPSPPTPGPEEQQPPQAHAQPLSSPEGSSRAGMSFARGRPHPDTISDTLTSQLMSDVIDGADPPEGNSFSFWLQWTVPAISMALVTKDRERQLKLRLDMEECQSSFDWTPIYFKLKFRMLSANVRCFVLNSSADWAESANMGIVVSCGDDISNDIMFVNAATNNVEILPHTRHFEGDGSVFNFVYTRAETNSVRKKWKELLRRKPTATAVGTGVEQEGEAGVAAEDESRLVSEIDLKLAPLDVVLSPAEIMPFLKMTTRLFAMKVPRKLSLSALARPSVVGRAASSGGRGEVLGLGVNNNTLPLVYLKAKTFRVFLLSANAPRTDSHAALSPDFALFQMETATISPQAENPLSRVLLRPDLYHMARPVLSIPGSHIEDRQYQIDLTGVGIYTGRWTDLLKKSEKPPKPLLKTMGENPAFEWNTLPSSGAGSAGDPLPAEVLFFPCLSKFDVQVTVAPAIVLDQQRKQQNSKLIAGHSLEVNATSNIAIFFSLSQISLSSLLLQEAVENAGYLYGRICSRSASVSDSGVDCEASSSKQSKSQEPLSAAATADGSLRRFVPTEILVTGSNISCALFRLSEGERGEAPTTRDRSMWRKYRYKNRRGEIAEERSSSLQILTAAAVADESESENCAKLGLPDKPQSVLDFGYEASEEGSASDELRGAGIRIYPLVHVAVSQPHAFLSCSRQKQKLDVSFFDASVNMSPPDYFITGGGKR